jgi:tetratricopeptide (TPR) repeat protein
MDPQFARAWEALAAVRGVATSWFPGDGIDHNSLALAAAHRALEIDPGLSMAYAVIGMSNRNAAEGYTGAVKNLDIAIDNDPKNATAWFWRGIALKDMGYLDEALADFEQCLKIDPGYLICRQYRASSLLGVGQIESAIKHFEASFEDNFHTADDSFVSYYVRTGQRERALLIASLALMPNAAAPVKDWIEAIENPLEDHSDRVARFNQWGEAYNIDVCNMDDVAIALRQEQCFSTIANAALNWHPDTAYYRKTAAFKDFVNTHFMAYWLENGFPAQCRVLDESDFECD